ncbi:hypothetical protein AAFF27_18580 [Xylophilus sp. GW821-FHT01B05]
MHTQVADPLRTLGHPAEPPSPLVLRARGSFYVGGERVAQSALEAGRPGLAGHVVIHQMYVEYMVPACDCLLAPLVLVHGTTKSGKTYDTTPDGRMGWFEHFVRRGHPTYVVDQVARGRSGFDQSAFNRVRAGDAPPSEQANISRFNEEFAWCSMRFGPSFGEAYPDTKFPVHAAFALAQQNIPDLNATLPSPNPTWKALSDLARMLDGAVLVGHSQSGAFPLDAALLCPHAVRGAVIVEPGSQGCKSTVYSDAQIAALAAVPTLVVFGDHLDTDTRQPHAPHLWRDAFDDSMRYIARVRQAGGTASMLHLPALGLQGNSHLLMQDTNNLEVADLVSQWIAKEVPST